jgi:diguanylate cyclase (GGDEF)-like protein
MGIAAIAVAGTGAGVAMLSILLARRRVKRADERVDSAVAELTERMETMLGHLDEALEQAQGEARLSRAYVDLAGSIEVDEVFGRTLEAGASLPGVDAVLLTVPAGDGPPLVRALGMSADETERRPISGPPDGRAARAVRVSYHYGEDELRAGSEFIYGGIAVPVPLAHETVGSLAIFTRSPAHQFAEREVRELEDLAARAGPAVANAVRFREARQQADLDFLTRLYNRRVFHETLAREAARARRYERRLSLIVFDVDDFKAVNERLGHLAADNVLAEVAERVRATVRRSDVACRVGGDEFAVVMPESTLRDGVRLAERLQAAIASPAVLQAGHVGMSAGVAELVPGDDARSLFERADHALHEAKGEGKGRVVLAGSARAG